MGIYLDLVRDILNKDNVVTSYTEEIVARQKDKPYDIGVFNDGVKGDSGELAGMPTPDEDRFDESDFNLSLRYPHAIRKMWGDEIAIEVMEAMLLNKPFELLKLKLLQKGEQDAR